MRIFMDVARQKLNPSNCRTFTIEIVDVTFQGQQPRYKVMALVWPHSHTDHSTRRYAAIEEATFSTIHS